VTGVPARPASWVTDVPEARVCSAHDSRTPVLDRSVEAELRERRTATRHGLPEVRLARALTP